jgi:hypothetical protein
MSNHKKRVNFSGEEKVAILRAHFVEGLLVQKNEVIAELLLEHVQLKKANGDPWVDFHYEHPLEGYRRLTVYNVLRQADVLRPRGKESRKGKGFVQPLTAHEHWHIDVAYIYIAGTFVFMARHGAHELTDDGRKNLQRIEKPCDNRLTLTFPQVSLRKTGLCWEATRAPERCRRPVLWTPLCRAPPGTVAALGQPLLLPFAQSQPTHSAEPFDGLPGVWGLAPSIPPKISPKSVSVFQYLSTGQTLSPVWPVQLSPGGWRAT